MGALRDHTDLDRRVRSREGSASIVADLVGHGDGAVAWLLATVPDANTASRVLIATTLLDALGRQALPVLHVLAADRDRDVRHTAIRELIDAGPEEVAPHLPRLRRDATTGSDIDSRISALNMLVSLGDRSLHAELSAWAADPNRPRWLQARSLLLALDRPDAIVTAVATETDVDLLHCLAGAALALAAPEVEQALRSRAGREADPLEAYFLRLADGIAAQRARRRSLAQPAPPVAPATP